MQPKAPQSPWDYHLHWLPSKANYFMALFNLVVSSVWSVSHLQRCAECSDKWLACVLGKLMDRNLKPEGSPACSGGRSCECWGGHYSPSPLLSAPFCSLFGGGSVAELVMEWLKTSFSEGCNTNQWLLDQNKCSREYTCKQFHSHL